MKYTLPSNDKSASRTTAYVGTVTSKDDPELEVIRENVRRQNKETRERIRKALASGKKDYAMNILKWNKIKRVTFMARGPRRDDNGNHLHASCDSSLRHDLATHFYVYIADDSSNYHRMKDEIEYGSLKIAELVRDVSTAYTNAKWKAIHEVREHYGIDYAQAQEIVDVYLKDAKYY